MAVKKVVEKKKAAKEAVSPKVSVGGWKVREIRNTNWISLIETEDGRVIKAVLIRQSFKNKKPANAGDIVKKALHCLSTVEAALRGAFGEIPAEFVEILQGLNQIDVRRTRAGFSVKYRYNLSARKTRYFTGFFDEKWSLICLSEPRESGKGVRA